MAVSDVLICNLALQKLGAARITSLTDNSRNARSVNACYELLRDKELRLHPWNFAVTRIVLAPSATTPPFDYNFAFPLPSDCLRLLLPTRPFLDWRLEQQGAVSCILTNHGPSINVSYIQRVTDPTRFDVAFVEALACKIGWHCCEEITQSNDKKKDLLAEYKQVMGEARRANAFEDLAQDSPADDWDTARLVGSVFNNTLSGFLSRA